MYAEGDHYVLEDAESFNGTSVNNVRIKKVVLKDGDKALIGKHTIEFSAHAQDVWHGASTFDGQSQGVKAKPPQLERTAFLDTAKAKEMIAMAAAASSAGSASVSSKGRCSKAQLPLLCRAGRASDYRHAELSWEGQNRSEKLRFDQSRLTVVGKSKMAGIRLKRWFAPHVAASIYRADDGYYIAASGDNVNVRVNGAAVQGGKQIEAGDIVEVAGIKAVFGFCEA